MKDPLSLLRSIHGRFHEWRTIKFPLLIERLNNPKAIYLVYTPEHGNLGDHAIAQSEIEILKELEIPYIEYSGHKLKQLQQNNCLNVMNGRTILINGGGNLGTLWMDIELTERAIIENNPKSSIMILPNTIFYDDSEQGREEFKKSKRIYNTHKKLYMYAREKTSYFIMKNAYHNVKLVPDMVLSLNKCKDGGKRFGCLLCLRNDREKTRTKEQDEIVRQQAYELFGEAIIITDMVETGPIPVALREQKLDDKFDQFRASELVITDRLHAMIFAAITGTPCVVIDSKSPKVRGCYEWISNLDYIRFADDVSQIAEEYRKIPPGIHRYSNAHLKQYYQELADDILQIIHRR